jgi:hypothetical protein
MLAGVSLEELLGPVGPGLLPGRLDRRLRGAAVATFKQRRHIWVSILPSGASAGASNTPDLSFPYRTCLPAVGSGVAEDVQRPLPTVTARLSTCCSS